MKYLKRAARTAEADQSDVSAAVQKILSEIKINGEAAARCYAKEFDKWDGEIVISQEQRKAAAAFLPDQLKADIHFAHDNVRRFAEAQLATATDFAVEILPGLTAGQKQIPVSSAGCYVPGGRYSHVASAIMTITTAKVAGVSHIAACSPPRPGVGIPAAIVYTMDLCGADIILNMGGVQGVAAIANGLFGVRKADILVGPGNQYVAEAKRILFGQIGIDMVAGPTDSMVIADTTADAELVAADLIGQAEHGWNSPVWLVSSDAALAARVMTLVPELIEALPQPNRDSARAAWADFAEIILCADAEEMATVADDYAPEHLHVQADDLDWWLNRLRAYGSLFLGEETTVAFGDKTSGPNHVLPTSGAARYTGGLSVHKFMKTVTWQRATRAAARPLAEATARISRLEGMEGHARTADIRLTKFFPSRASI
ncbi:histidinol dehydrogenase [Mesorhizobium hungaricum]|jgi:sulfopropanediol 3-dehydrogenase|uniref:Histidinol dehydrogenase n=1 Tax=Mesorhizobium hungaricum TaxID=1566387 RepID=A0A1C2E772_9HYPH|nr:MULTISPECIES: histidinol dehydrogenase [Mesorhizobium]MBN9237319.1 histidinol dehydrogenase [Mesorhizobium sp.]MDQ0333245.1 sulfopropanediol 3-dehydrogenase [Mesorhizobium sp. YL-MeA3-2017]OCX22834.1 histidinol dehydrogenase [Mesorhizobium hungaricum]